MKKILIIEDEKDLANSYGQELKKSGYDVLIAYDGYSGLDMLKNSNDISLVILDLMMPGIDGLEVLRIMRKDKEVYKDPTIFVLTNMTSDKVIKEAFELNISKYLIKKEVQYIELFNEIRNVLEG